MTLVDLLVKYSCRYLVNYSPFDVVYKACKFGPIKLALFVMKEIQRTNKVHHGVAYAAKLFPGSYLVIVIIGVVKGEYFSSEATVDLSAFSHWPEQVPHCKGFVL